ncbi:MAG: hypothetical protein ACRDJS_10825 [Actinomycetota bacterium]
MTAATLLGALAQVAVILIVGWVTGDLLVRMAAPSASTPSSDDVRPRAAPGPGFDFPGLWVPERALLAIVGFLGWCIALMIGHIVTGGAVFGLAPVAPIATALLVATLLRRTRWVRQVPWPKLVAAVFVLFTLFALPAIDGGSGVRTGDPPWHLGWTEQLLAGEPTPSGPAPNARNNAYPWGFHAVLAALVRLVPGTTPLVAHEALHLLILLGIPLGAACLARRLHPRAGWGGAAAVALIGGFGWITAREPDFVTSPSEARYGADLVVASPNSMYELLPPAAPREVGLIVLAAAATLLVLSLRAEQRSLRVLAGVVTGMVGLISVPLFVTALVWMVAGSLTADRGRRFRNLGEIALPAAIVFALWAGPVAANFIQLGGFVDITPKLGMEWPLPTALWSWGLLLPLAVAGFLGAMRTRHSQARTMLALAAGSAFTLALAIARGTFEWDLGGNTTLLHQGRVWPPAHLLAAAFAGLGLISVYEWVARGAPGLARAGLVGVLGIGATSPLLGSARLAEIIEAREEGFHYARPEIEGGSFVQRAANILTPDDVVLVEGSNDLGFLLFQFSGVKLAAHDDSRLQHNDLRIRYRELAESWDRRMERGGFEADYRVEPVASEAPDEAIVVGDYGGETWALLGRSE